MQVRTWISNTDSDVASLEGCAIESQGLLESISRSELGISKSLRLHLKLVLDDPDICTFAASEKIGDIANSGIEGEVAEMYSVGWLVGEW
tara:strand:- start:838 stop:1107 length:270 start_codon:yes stop_codon:yes gene_type:complete